MIMITEEAGFLRLLTWLSPAFPTGGFAYSHGLEWAVESGDARSTAGLIGWLVDILEEGSGRTDAILLRHAHRASLDPEALAEVAELSPPRSPVHANAGWRRPPRAVHSWPPPLPGRRRCWPCWRTARSPIR